MADIYNNLTLARQEWEAADKHMKLRAFILAECFVIDCLSPYGPVVAEYNAARAAEQAAWHRYIGISHADEEVSA